MVRINLPTNIKRIQFGSPFQGKKLEELKKKTEVEVKSQIVFIPKFVPNKKD